MKTDRPFRKSFACAAALFILLVASVTLIRGKDLHQILVALAVCFAIALISGSLGYLSKKPWSWVRFASIVVGLFLVYVFGLQFVRYLTSSAGPH